MAEETNHSTVDFMAFLRGFHAACDRPCIFDDFLALDLLGPDQCENLKKQHTVPEMIPFAEHFGAKSLSEVTDRDELMTRIIHATSPLPLMVSRARHTEDALEEALARGCLQYVILGAGLDTFAFRRLKVLKDLMVFEVDRPRIQDYKRRCIAAAGWVEPERLRFVPADFLSDDLASSLSRVGFNSCAPTFFSCLGVTYYLTREAVLSLFGAIVRIAAPGTEVAFDFAHPDIFDPTKSSELTQLGLGYMRQVGEPWITAFTLDALADALRQRGLTLTESLSPNEIGDRYFRDRSDGYQPYEHVYFARAMVTA